MYIKYELYRAKNQELFIGIIDLIIKYKFCLSIPIYCINVNLHIRH